MLNVASTSLPSAGLPANLAGRRPRRRPEHPALLLTATLAVLLLSACSGPASAPGPTTDVGAALGARLSGAGNPQPPATADRVAAEGAYRAFWPVLTSFDRRFPESQWVAVVGRVAVDPQLSQALAVARQQRRTGVTLYGVPRPRAVRVTLEAGRRAAVVDCADFSRYGQADARTGQRRTVGIARTPLRATLVQGRDGTWRVAQVTYPGGTC